DAQQLRLGIRVQDKIAIKFYRRFDHSRIKQVRYNYAGRFHQLTDPDQRNAQVFGSKTYGTATLFVLHHAPRTVFGKYYIAAPGRCEHQISSVQTERVVHVEAAEAHLLAALSDVDETVYWAAD